jgi:hypothetical protein
MTDLPNLSPYRFSNSKRGKQLEIALRIILDEHKDVILDAYESKIIKTLDSGDDTTHFLMGMMLSNDRICGNCHFDFIKDSLVRGVEWCITVAIEENIEWLSQPSFSGRKKEQEIKIRNHLEKAYNMLISLPGRYVFVSNLKGVIDEFNDICNDDDPNELGLFDNPNLVREGIGVSIGRVFFRYNLPIKKSYKTERNLFDDLQSIIKLASINPASINLEKDGYNLQKLYPSIPIIPQE